MIHKPSPLLVVDLFPEILTALVRLLDDLSADEWERPTVAPGWTVKDMALHLLGDDIGLLSAQRDAFADERSPAGDLGAFGVWLNRRNELWVQAARRISPRLLCDLLQVVGDQMNAYFRSPDPMAVGRPLYFAGPDPAPVWLDLGRGYAERWSHQQHIRNAVGKPGLTEPRYLSPVLATYVHALPRTYATIDAEDGTSVALTITGNSGSSWSIRRESQRWQLYSGVADRPRAHVLLPEDIAWRLFTKGISKETARRLATLSGDPTLAGHLLETVAIMG